MAIGSFLTAFADYLMLPLDEPTSSPSSPAPFAPARGLRQRVARLLLVFRSARATHR